jgi:hypothetical protein
LIESRRTPCDAAGVAGALFVVVSLLAGQIATVRAAWARVAVQVAGSWIAAIGLFMLGCRCAGAENGPHIGIHGGFHLGGYPLRASNLYLADHVAQALDPAGEAAAPGFAACAQQYIGCVRACPPA